MTKGSVSRLENKMLTLKEIGERYERMKLELFKERNKNREIIEDLQEVKLAPKSPVDLNQ